MEKENKYVYLNSLIGGKHVLFRWVIVLARCRLFKSRTDIFFILKCYECL